MRYFSGTTIYFMLRMHANFTEWIYLVSGPVAWNSLPFKLLTASDTVDF